MNAFRSIDHAALSVASLTGEAPGGAADGPSLPETIIELAATLAAIAGAIVAVLNAVDLLS